MVELEAAFPVADAVSVDVLVLESLEVLEGPLQDIKGRTKHAA